MVAAQTLTQQELESRLWAAANSLRGPVDPADFKNFVFPILFLKWISDTWDLDHAAAVVDFGSDVSPEEEADYHRFDMPKGCHWRDLNKVSVNVGVELQKILQRLEEANPNSLAGIFGDVAWANKERLPESALLNLIDSFDSLTLNREVVSNDMLGAAYEYLLRQFADESGKKAGEFFTPRAIVRLLVRILDPQPGEAVYDPACGSGGMLVETINEIREAKGDTRTLRLYGQEVNLTTAAIARMNLFLHDLEDFRIIRGDTLRSPRFLDRDGLQQFDVVLANPPFILPNWGSGEWAGDPYGRAICGVPPAANADLAWIQHMVASMRDLTGRMAVVMPHGVLFREDSELPIRRCILESGRVEAVIGLPPNVFYNTQMEACVLVLRSNMPEMRLDRVRLVDASSRFVKAGSRNTLSDEDLAAILAAYESNETLDGEGGLAARSVSLAEIAESGWNLRLDAYLPTALPPLLEPADAANALADALDGLDRARRGLSDALRGVLDVRL
jgi:type I restriction enzyme M protein